jgi:hypothetical protein
VSYHERGNDDDDIRKIHVGSLPPLAYGNEGYTGRFRPILIHFPGLDSYSDRAYDDRSDRSSYVGLDRQTNIPKGFYDQRSSLTLSTFLCR